MNNTQERSFKAYYAYYLTLHRNRTNRILHVIGQIWTVIYLITVLWLMLNVNAWFALLLISVPFVIYPIVWFGHLHYEKNKPASWTNPVWAKAADWCFFYDVLRGRERL